MTKEIKSIFNLENNTLFTFPELYPYIRYNLSIKSKILDELEYEITLKNTNISSPPFQYISLNEYPSTASHTYKLTFKKYGNDIKASSLFKNINYNTEYTTLLIKSYEYVTDTTDISDGIEQHDNYQGKRDCRAHGLT